MIDEVLSELVSSAPLPGLSVAIMQDGQMIYRKGYGYADIENGLEMQTSTRLRTASVAKIMTATALGTLASEKEVDFDTPISAYWPEVPPQFSMLTLRQLASHTSGLKHRPDRKIKQKVHYSPIAESVTLFKNQKLLYTPGEEYRYSTNGYTLIAAVIEQIAGVPYLEYVNDHLFKPLNMIDTRAEVIRNLNERDARSYAVKNNKIRLEKKLENGSYKLAGAAFRSTPTDLVQMMTAYQDGQIDQEVIGEMFSSTKTNNQENTQVGIGWRTNTDPYGRRVYDHAGNWQGARTIVSYYAKERLAISIMVNARWQGFIAETAQMIGAIWLNEEMSTTDSCSEVSDVIGTFTNSSGKVFEYEGRLECEQQVGYIKLDTDKKYIQSIAIYGFRSRYDYVAVTPIGILFFRMEEENGNWGNLYLYQSRSDKSPLDSQPILSIRRK